MILSPLRNLLLPRPGRRDFARPVSRTVFEPFVVAPRSPRTRWRRGRRPVPRRHSPWCPQYRMADGDLQLLGDDGAIHLDDTGARYLTCCCSSSPGFYRATKCVGLGGSPSFVWIAAASVTHFPFCFQESSSGDHFYIDEDSLFQETTVGVVVTDYTVEAACCPSSCPVCLPSVKSGRYYTLAFGGITLCPCVGGGGTSSRLVGDPNGAFDATMVDCRWWGEDGFDPVVPYGVVRWEQYLNDTCDGDPLDQTWPTGNVAIRFSLITREVTMYVRQLGYDFPIFRGFYPSGSVTDCSETIVLTNFNTSCSITGVATPMGYGGQVAIIPREGD